MASKSRRIQHKKSKPRKRVAQRPHRSAEPRLDRHPLPLSLEKLQAQIGQPDRPCD